MKFWSFTFGCKVNQYETELFKEQVLRPGDMQVANPRDADICFINTCTVTAFADKEARQVVRRALRGNPNARIIVTGCYATRSPQDFKEISKRLEVYSNSEKEGLPSCCGFEISSKPLGIQRFSGRSRAFLKVQDGCLAPCNYCIIPKVRPQLWSKPFEDVLSEAEGLVNNGYEELVLTGIRLGLYKVGSVNLVELLKRLVGLPGHFRIRLSSLEVTEVSDSLVKFVAENSKVCRHFHIPIQAGHSAVLKAMGRWYDLDFFKKRVVQIKRLIPDCGITSDVIAGFPSETDLQFSEGLKNIEELGFSGLHVFRFSGREGTKAARLQVLHPRVVNARAKAMRELDRKLREKFFRRFEGTVRQTLCESSREGWTDNYIRVEIPADLVKTGLLHTRVWSSRFSPGGKCKLAEGGVQINV